MATTTSSPFLRHLSFFDRQSTGTITPLDSLRGCLSVGMDFPVSVIAMCGLHMLYGTAGFLSLTRIDISRVQQRRTMLEGFALRKEYYTRDDLAKAAKGMNWTDWGHVMSLWTLASDSEGRVSKGDVAAFQRGEILDVLERRRKDNRSDVLPFLRGGPISYVELIALWAVSDRLTHHQGSRAFVGCEEILWCRCVSGLEAVKLSNISLITSQKVAALKIGFEHHATINCGHSYRVDNREIFGSGVSLLNWLTKTVCLMAMFLLNPKPKCKDLRVPLAPRGLCHRFSADRQHEYG